MIITDGTRTIAITIKDVRIDNLFDRTDITEDVFCDLTKNEDGVYQAEDVDISIQTARDFCKGVGEYYFDHTQEPTFYVGLDIWDIDKDECIEYAPDNVTEWYRH